MSRDDWQRLYNTARWVRVRRAQLAGEPLCRKCKAQGHRTLGTVADHIKPHKGDLALFFDHDNLQTLCKPHHDATKAIEERGGYEPGCDVHGNPIDQAHRWNGGVGNHNG